MDINEINTRLLIWRKKGSPENEIIKRIYSNSDSRDKEKMRIRQIKYKTK